MVPRPGKRNAYSSWKASSRFFLIDGNITTTTINAAAINSADESGRVRKVVQSPRESSKARRRFYSIIGPRMKPSSSGAGSQPSL